METENARTTCTTSTVTSKSISCPACGGLRWPVKDTVRKPAVNKCLELPDTPLQNVLSKLDARRWRIDTLFKTPDSDFELRAGNAWNHEKKRAALHQDLQSNLRSSMRPTQPAAQSSRGRGDARVHFRFTKSITLRL